MLLTIKLSCVTEGITEEGLSTLVTVPVFLLSSCYFVVGRLANVLCKSAGQTGDDRGEFGAPSSVGRGRARERWASQREGGRRERGGGGRERVRVREKCGEQSGCGLV